MTPVPDPSEVGEPDVAKNTSEDVGAEQRERIPGLFFAERHRGPVPHPIILEGYDALVPGTAKKMIENAIRRAELRTEDERKTANLRRILEVASRLMAFAVVLVTIYLGYQLAATGVTAVGFALVVTAALTIAGSFLLYAWGSSKDSRRTADLNSAVKNSNRDEIDG